MKTNNHLFNKLKVSLKLEKLSPSTRGRGKEGESRDLCRVGAGESSASKTTGTY